MSKELSRESINPLKDRIRSGVLPVVRFGTVAEVAVGLFILGLTPSAIIGHADLLTGGTFALIMPTVTLGGGVAEGGDYSLEGFISAEDLGTIRGEIYELAGGVLSLALAMPDREVPRLFIIGAERGITLSWTSEPGEYLLQQTDALDKPWIPAATGTQNPVILPFAGESRYFRIIRQWPLTIPNGRLHTNCSTGFDRVQPHQVSRICET